MEEIEYPAYITSTTEPHYEEPDPCGLPIQAGVQAQNLMEVLTQALTRPELSNLERLVLAHSDDLLTNTPTVEKTRRVALFSRLTCGQWFLAGAVMGSLDSQIELGMSEKEVVQMNKARELIWAKLNNHPALKQPVNTEYNKLFLILEGARSRRPIEDELNEIETIF